MADVNISKYRASVVREGSKPASPGFVVSEGQSPTDPAGTGQNHLPVTIAAASTALSITESQILSGAGTVSQYIRGDGSLADFPESSGGGSSVSYYLNGSVNQATIGGVAYKELNKVPILGAGTDFTINANGYIASFLTDAGDPNLLEIPGGNWNFETYFSANNGGGSPTFYVELYKYNGTTFTLLASNSAIPELIAFGTNITAYFTTLAVPTTTLALTDRLAVRYYVTHSGRTITMHTEGPHLCQIITTFTTGLTALNGLTAQVQNFATGTSGTDFNIASATATHTFNLPTASATNRGALSSADWTTFNNKQNALGYVPVPETRTITINGTTQDLSANRTYNVGTVTSVAALTLGTSGTDLSSTVANGTTTPVITLNVPTASATNRGALSAADWSTFNGKQNALTLTTTGSSGAATLVGSTLNIPNYSPDLSGYVPTSRTITINGTTQDLSANRTFNVGTVTSVGLSSATSGVTIGSTPVTTSGTITLAIATASGSQNGLLSSTDWTTFNGKQNALTNPVTGTGTTNYLAKFTGSTTVGNSQLFDNGTNVGIGTASPTEKLDVLGVFRNLVPSAPPVGGMITSKVLSYSLNPYGLIFRSYPSGVQSIQSQREGNDGELFGLSLQPLGGNVGIGTASPNSILELSSTTPVLRIQASSSSDFHGLEFRQGAGLDATIKQLPVTGEFRISNGRTTGWGGFTTFYIDTVEAARFTASRNLLVGTTTDSGYKLNVNGYTKSLGYSFNAYSGGGEWQIGSDAATGSGLYLYQTTFGYSVIIGSSGNATFGSSVTATSFSNAGLQATEVINATKSNAGYFVAYFQNTSATGLGLNIQNGNDANDCVRISNAAGSANPIKLFGSGKAYFAGNVLIGTETDAGQRLQVSGSIYLLTGGNRNIRIGSATNYYYDLQSTNDDFQIIEAGSTPRLTIKYPNGNVGIGSTSPGVRLVNSGATLASLPTLGSGTIGANAILSANGLYGLYTGVSSEGHVWQQVQRNDASSAVYPLVLQPSGGNVLIGSTTDNGSKLQVNGAIRTAQPVGTTSNGWLLGRALVSGTSTPDRWIRVQIGLEYYDILAVYMGTL